MGSQGTFQQILEEKIAILEENKSENAEYIATEGHSPRANNDVSEENSAFEDLIATLLNENVNFKLGRSPEHVRRSYPVPPRKKTVKPRPAERTVLVKDLSPNEKAAVSALVELGANELKTLDLLSESIVKKAFRRLALNLHPDQNPLASPSNFRKARESYLLLLKRVK